VPNIGTDSLTPVNGFSDLPFTPSTLVELLRWRALHQSDRLAYTFFMDEEEVRWTYEDLDRKARAIAALLQSMGVTDERVLLLYHPGLDYIAGLFGCLYAGVIAVPAYPPHPSRLNRTVPRLQAIVQDAQATLALTTQHVLSALELFSPGHPELGHLEGLASLRWLAADSIDTGLADAWQEPQLARETLAYLQYTSGSTGSPKGVMVSHGNVLHNAAALQQAWQMPTDGEMVSWLPLFHDMGLVGSVLTPLCNGYHSTLMAPSAFLQRPLRWLQVISR
jgi:acyl-CoA synthetase (AMP-forming)/AMP-acid ligase II